MQEHTLEDIAGWIAPAATMIAAMMTAANLGARITGWGFVVFTVGSVAWSTVGALSGQTNLVVSNGFLTIVNLVGIWRWLGRQRAIEDGSQSAVEASRRSSHPTLFSATGIAGVPVFDANGELVGKVVEALVACERGEVSYIVIGSGGVGGAGEQLRAVPRAEVRFSCDQFALLRDRAWFAALPPLPEGDWPATPAKLSGAEA